MTPPAPPLKLGVLTDGDEIPDWLADSLREVTERGIGHIELVIQRVDPSSHRATEPPSRRAAEPPSRLSSWWRNRSQLAFALARRLDGKRGSMPAPRSLRSLAPDARLMKVTPLTGRFTDTFGAEDVAAVRAARLDVIVRAGFRILKGEILDAARLGVWSFHHGDNRTNRGGPPGVWEVLENRDVTGVTLQRITAELDGGEVLARSVGRTERFSFARNVAALYPRSGRMLTRSLERAWSGRSPVQASGDHGPAEAYHHRLYRQPRNGELLSHGTRLAGAWLRQRTRWRGREASWSLAWHFAPGREGAEPHAVLHRYREIIPPADRFEADPFVVRDGERWWMFYEEFPWATRRGRIAVREVSHRGPVAETRVVLDLPTHLSYPFVFRHEGEWYLMPESNQSKRLELYRAVEFPWRWESHATLLDPFDGVDATLHRHTDGRWYLFANLGEPGISYDEELHLFVADSPFGPFAAHPENPVVADVRRARMAGRLFESGGELVRPAQRCAPLYGAGLVLHVVEELSPVTYRERVVQELSPAWDQSLVGVHTINAEDGLSVIDLQRAIRIPS